MSTDMNLDTAKLKRWREERCWSQDHLAATSGLSLRTIQRLERGEGVSRETARALAAAYAVGVEALMVDPETKANELADQRKEAMQSQARKMFLIHLLVFLGAMGPLVVMDIVGTPGESWTIWPALGWATTLFAHGITVLASGLDLDEG
ncbi:MAG: helix-turn-helix domain-containing protein [Parvularculaceae bacterium]|nr:helix-turn-helix domain-containing protein [Parvularculaceae bacterium]